MAIPRRGGERQRVVVGECEKSPLPWRLISRARANRRAGRGESPHSKFRKEREILNGGRRVLELPMARVTLGSGLVLVCCYNSQVGQQSMLLMENHLGKRVLRRWEVAVVVLAICGLTLSLATRTFRTRFSSGTIVKSISGQPVRQHMDSDAAKWVPPVSTFTVLEVPVFYPRLAPAGPPLPRLYYEESLSNRPPPFHS